MGHDYGTPVYEWSEDGKTCTAKVVCSHDTGHVVIEEGTIENGVITSTVKTPATEESEGVTTYTATFTHAEFTTQTKDVADIPKKGGTTLTTGNTTTSDTANNGGTTPQTPSTSGTEVKTGDIVKDNKTNTSYVITSTETNNETVAYVSTANKTASTLTVPDTVTVSGRKYKVTEIKANALKNNKKLKKVTIGKNIERIGKNAFSGCKNLKNVNIKTVKLTKKTVGANAFKGIHDKAKVKVPKSKLKDYKTILKARGIKGKNQKITK